MGWSLLPNALRPFQINYGLLNLGITRTWVCRLNFAQSGLRFFNEPEISDSGPPAYSPTRRTCAEDFYVLKKSIDLSRIWTREPWISRRARYPETTEVELVDDSGKRGFCSLGSPMLFEGVSQTSITLYFNLLKTAKINSCK